MSGDNLKWWAVSAGTENGLEGEGDARIRAVDEDRARELYLSNRPGSWVIFSIEPSSAPEVRDARAIAAETAARLEAESEASG